MTSIYHEISEEEALRIAKAHELDANETDDTLENDLDNVNTEV